MALMTFSSPKRNDVILNGRTAAQGIRICQASCRSAGTEPQSLLVTQARNRIQSRRLYKGSEPTNFCRSGLEIKSVNPPSCRVHCRKQPTSARCSCA